MNSFFILKAVAIENIKEIVLLEMVKNQVTKCLLKNQCSVLAYS